MKQLQLLCLYAIALILLNSLVLSLKNENYSEMSKFESLNIPGFSSAANIGSILSENQNKEEINNLYQDLVAEKVSINPLEELPAENSEINMLEERASMENDKPYLVENAVELSEWFSISSKDFTNRKKFPDVDTDDGNMAIQYRLKDQRRINPKFKKGGKIPNKHAFWFRLSKHYMWYTFDKENINILGRFRISHVRFLRYEIRKADKEFCFSVTIKNKSIWTICSASNANITKFFCILIKYSGLGKSDTCDPRKYQGKLGAQGTFVVQTVTQPLIIIPVASHNCNAGWNYGKKGSDWECLCKEGLQQSPIDLPPISLGIATDAKPVFDYERVEPKMTNDFAAAGINAGDKNVIRLEQETLKIKHPKFGKIVTLDGAVYYAQEIIFHTPSEHKINGVTFEMEMQIIHRGKSVGDTLKTVILSFLFKSKPGSFNKFIDKLDFFDLPNPLEKARELNSALFIPQILQDSNDEDLSFMQPFSFYTYQGSFTAPPCQEKTIHMVASKPVELSNTALEMFKESLRIPDQMDNNGNVKLSNSSLDNARLTQPLNGRAVFHYNHADFGCPQMNLKKSKQGGGGSGEGHYERVDRTATEYFFVNGQKPSGIPNAFVVPTKEALDDGGAGGM